MKMISGVILFMCAFTAGAQLSRQEAEAMLCNAESRSWDYRHYEGTFGASCLGGQVLKFLHDGTLVQTRCINGKPSIKTLNWRVVPVPGGVNGQWQLSLSDMLEIKEGMKIKEVRIDFPKGAIKKKGAKMILRDMAGNDGGILKIHFVSIN